MIEFHKNNPIGTSYQLLWAELRRKRGASAYVTKHYAKNFGELFQILGGVDTYHLVDKFEGLEKVQCQSLMGWVNDGSHYASDELYVVISDNMAASYMTIFFKIFKAAKHDAHYRMMMGDDYVDLDPYESVEQQVETGASENGAVVAGDADAPDLPIIVPGLSAIQTDGAALASVSAPIVPNPEVDQPEADPEIPF